MKIVLNKCFGGFGLSEKANHDLDHLDLNGESYLDNLSFEPEDNYLIFRSNKKLIEYLENHQNSEYNGDYADLRIVDIPDNITDIKLDEYDGYETILVVVNGKIYEY